MGSHRYVQGPRKPVTVSLEELKHSSVPLETLEEAFGPSSLGIMLVSDLPANFLDLRLRVLSYASYLPNLVPEELEALSCPEAKYLSGWSHGKEALKSGSYDTLKGSFYANCAFYQGKDVTVNPSMDFAEFTASNVWPKETSLPGFQKMFEELCILIIDTAALVARACDNYATACVADYEPGYLERVVKTSTVTKARLLHYFPPSPSAADQDKAMSPGPPALNLPEHDSWCATHVDHGFLTGLTSALYIDESAHPPLPSTSNRMTRAPHLPVLPHIPSLPDSDAGLYIHARDSTITKVSIPHDCLGFQTGEALQVITGGAFRAVPHFVRAVEGERRNGMKVARNTLAVFTQPSLEEIIDRGKGTTFGEFSRDVVGRFG